MNKQMDQERITLTIDSDNIITDIGGAWEQSALIGHIAEAFAPDRLIGQHIENYMGGDVTQMYYESLFKLCRLRQEPVTRNYRCDSPTHQRLMEVTLIPQKERAIEMVHKALDEMPFKHRVEINATSGIIKVPTYIKRCNICNRLLFPKRTRWQFPEEINDDAPVSMNVIHTVCMDCKNRNWLPASLTSK